VAWCRAVGIPARVVLGSWVGGRMRAHAWAGLHADGTGWVPVDPSISRRRQSSRCWARGGCRRAALVTWRIAVAVAALWLLVLTALLGLIRLDGTALDLVRIAAIAALIGAAVTRAALG